MHPETIVIFGSKSGHPVMINSRAVVAIETLASGRNTLLGAIVILENGREIDISDSVPEATSKLFPVFRV